VAAFKSGANAAAVKLVAALGDLPQASHKEYRKAGLR
jgi:hypothetical protein